MRLERVSCFLVFLIIVFAVHPGRIGSELPAPEIYVSSFVQAVIDAKKAAPIDSFFQRRNHYHNFNGTVLVADKGRIVYEKAYGYADLLSKDTLSTSTSFQLASVSKPLTATAVLLLYQDGKLCLEDSIQKFIPDFPYKNITIRLLLAHRSGLPDYMYFSEKYWPDRSKLLTNRDVINMMIEHKPLIYYLPDRRYNYSNTNFLLLASIVEKVSGMRFADFMKSRIFEPLNMKHSWVYDPSGNESLHDSESATGYIRYNRRAGNFYLNGVVGDKGIYSSVEDLFRFDNALYQGRLLRKSTLKLAFKPQHPDLHNYDNYGLGWRIIAKDGHTDFTYHTGWWKGFKTYFIRNIKEHQTVIVLTNTAWNSFIPVRTLIGLI